MASIFSSAEVALVEACIYNIYSTEKERESVLDSLENSNKVEKRRSNELLVETLDYIDRNHFNPCPSNDNEGKVVDDVKSGVTLEQDIFNLVQKHFESASTEEQAAKVEAITRACKRSNSEIFAKRGNAEATNNVAILESKSCRLRELSPLKERAFRKKVDKVPWDKEQFDSVQYIETVLRSWRRYRLPLALIKNINEKLGLAYYKEVRRKPQRSLANVIISSRTAPAGKPKSLWAYRAEELTAEQKAERNAAQKASRSQRQEDPDKSPSGRVHARHKQPSKATYPSP